MLLKNGGRTRAGLKAEAMRQGGNMIKSSSTGRLKGFTLIELLVVIAIIAILAALLLPVIGGVQDKAKQARCNFNLKNIAAAIKIYVLDYNDTPITGTALTQDTGIAQGSTSAPANTDPRGTGTNEYLALLLSQGQLDDLKVFVCSDPLKTVGTGANTFAYIYRNPDTATASSAIALCPNFNKHGKPKKVTPTAYYGGYAEIRDTALGSTLNPGAW